MEVLLSGRDGLDWILRRSSPSVSVYIIFTGPTPPQPNPRVVSLPFFHLPHTERAAGLLAGFKEEKCRDYRMFGSAMRTVNLPVLIIAQLE
ncbi:hypothetical protein NEUTE1DRAFT_149142 [Neurospora tetrasperma FGSC 2508]|uniref:Uncharacterized protein n=1 Tax=Neurospora tetrasperma (strain FGSC 2508 / ATCC MYA-4615 / P0657) TaxID=510951 RepID=F8MXY5_NEUT8|nr:uncharacterized protein NEUTE1DRAFT_149142 [Neurospora tetrasperma FGSC 2508]EGO53838.1 hypothetical protein NEUTE1DRAFT_149142 [Neurospora tetrasperma FGSC 2508]